jgi:hypothetical protein
VCDHDTHGSILILYMASVRLKKVVGYNLKQKEVRKINRYPACDTPLGLDWHV